MNKKDIQTQEDEVKNLLYVSVTHAENADKDYRMHLTGVLNPDSTPYRLPKSHGEYKNIVEVLEYKPYTAYYPQSFVALPRYFSDENIEPYFSPKPWDDYALGTITISGMIQLNANGIPWLLGDLSKIDEIIRYTDIYYTVINDGTVATSHVQYVRNIVADFLQEMKDGADRAKLREISKSGKSSSGLSMSSIMRRLRNRGSNIS